PNTPGLRDLQRAEALRPILSAVRAAAAASAAREVPVLVKIAPDLADADVDAVARLAGELGLAGVVAANTTIAHDYGPGGLSGAPLLDRGVELVGRVRRILGPDAVIIGVGGISTAAHAQRYLDAGATVVQAYTAFIYRGPAWPGRVNRALVSGRGSLVCVGGVAPPLLAEDLVDTRHQLRGDLLPGSHHILGHLLRPGGTDQRRSHVGVLQYPGHRQLRHGQPELLGHRPQVLHPAQQLVAAEHPGDHLRPALVIGGP